MPDLVAEYKKDADGKIEPGNYIIYETRTMETVSGESADVLVPVADVTEESLFNMLEMFDAETKKFQDYISAIMLLKER